MNEGTNGEDAITVSRELRHHGIFRNRHLMELRHHGTARRGTARNRKRKPERRRVQGLVWAGFHVISFFFLSFFPFICTCADRSTGPYIRTYAPRPAHVGCLVTHSLSGLVGYLSTGRRLQSITYALGTPAKYSGRIVSYRVRCST